MFDPIFEGRPSIYFLLAAIGVGFWVAWYYNQRKRWLWYGVWGALAAVLLYAGVMYWPPAADFFQLTPLDGSRWGVVIAAATAALLPIYLAPNRAVG